MEESHRRESRVRDSRGSSKSSPHGPEDLHQPDWAQGVRPGQGQERVNCGRPVREEAGVSQGQEMSWGPLGSPWSQGGPGWWCLGTTRLDSLAQLGIGWLALAELIRQSLRSWFEGLRQSCGGGGVCGASGVVTTFLRTWEPPGGRQRDRLGELV